MTDDAHNRIHLEQYKAEYYQSVRTGGYIAQVQSLMMNFPPWGYYRIKKYNIPIRVGSLVTCRTPSPDTDPTSPTDQDGQDGPRGPSEGRRLQRFAVRAFIPMKNEVVESTNWTIDKIERITYFSFEDLEYLNARLDDRDMIIFIDRMGPANRRWEFMLNIKGE